MTVHVFVHKCTGQNLPYHIGLHILVKYSGNNIARAPDQNKLRLALTFQENKREDIYFVHRYFEFPSYTER